jgi:arylsulfatase
MRIQREEQAVSDTFDVIMAAYPSIGLAERDFDALVGLVKDRAVRSEGVILVEHDPDGKVSVSHTGDHLGRRGLGWGGGVGLVVGLFSPALLASIVVGGAAGALIGKFAKHKIDSGIEQGLGDKLAPGTAVVIAVVDGDDRLAAEQALAGSLAKSVAPMDGKGVRELKAALAEAAGKFSPDRTVLPIPDRNFGGTMGRTMDQSVPDWSMIPGPQAPEGAPNVLIVLIDDAGFGGPDTFGGPIATPNITRVQQMGLTYNRFHVTAVCSPTRAALLTGRNHHRVGFGSIAEFPGPFPGYTAARPRSCAALPRILQENGYVTGGFGKWHLTRTTCRARPARSPAGRRRGALTTGGGSCPARPVSTTRSSPRTTRRSACRRARTAASTTSRTT